MGPKNPRNSNIPPLCKDCNFCCRTLIGRLFGKTNEFVNCRHPLITKDYVTGSGSSMYCSTARRFEHLCGNEGKYFEPYDKKERMIYQVIKKLGRE